MTREISSVLKSFHGIAGEIPPDPSALINSLRSIGYNLRTAIADLIDNSITAGATKISIIGWWDGPSSYLTLLDNGGGMDIYDLTTAMTLGSSDPLAVRDKNDLGRFGLGLKTASFSQCQKLTVLSRKNKDICMACWDLEHVAERKRWQLLHDPGETTVDILEKHAFTGPGTLIVWEKMDRLTSQLGTDRAQGRARFNEMLDEIRTHLGMVFHEFIKKRSGLQITVNEKAVEPWDPFLAKHEATQILAEEEIKLGKESLTITCYVLPHHTRLTPEEHSRCSGTEGWNAHQGFYVYRNNRLLMAGDWLGLGSKKEEHYKLARIRIDLPNTMDSQWQIDVRKARAQVPDRLRKRLQGLAALTRSKASEVYRYRGKYLINPNSKVHVNLWVMKQTRGHNFWKLNREHPLYLAIKDEYGGKARSLEAFIQLIETTLPVASIGIEASSDPDKLGDMTAEIEKVSELAKKLYDALLPLKGSRSRTISEILTMDPFNRISDQLQTELEEYAKRC